MHLYLYSIFFTYIGIKSGKEVYRFILFNMFYGEFHTVSIINKASINHECKIERITDFGSTNEMSIGEIAILLSRNDNTHRA